MINEPDHRQIPPWKCPFHWAQMVHAFEHVTAVQWTRLEGARALARQIGQKLDAVDSTVDMLCDETCVRCMDVCCKKATVWYDYKDLLYLYLTSGQLPAGQISRRNDLFCSNLSSAGCRLHRTRRPFICTWYICPSQTSILAGTIDTQSVSRLPETLREIQALRRQLEQEFIDAVC